MNETQMIEIPESFGDLTPAAPAQGMNRSSDQIRAAMRIYVTDGRITEEGLESLVRIFLHGKSRQLSFEQTAKLFNYSGSTLSRVFAGKYSGDMEEVIEKVDSFLALEAEREKMMGDIFIETSTWLKVASTCDLSIKRNAITRLTGVSQIGKTHALKEYKRRAKFQCCYVRIPAAPTFKLVVDAVCTAVGVNSSLRIEEARPRVANAIGRNTLIIIDELHELIMSAGKSTAMKVLEWFREIWDNSGCGMVLCGTSAMEDDLINDPKMKGWLGQLDHRCIRVTKLPNQIPGEDIDLAAKAYGITGNKACVENILKGIRMNRLTTCLNMTASWCAGNNKTKQTHPKTWESFKAVYKSTFQEG